jgi:hypothetical protein
MTLQRQIANYLSSEPFRPFRITLTSGEIYDINDPDTFTVGRTTCHVYAWASDDENLARDHRYVLPLAQVESVELLNDPATPDQRPN